MSMRFGMLAVAVATSINVLHPQDGVL